jgi:hypothetical protein
MAIMTNNKKSFDFHLLADRLKFIQVLLFVLVFGFFGDVVFLELVLRCSNHF